MISHIIRAARSTDKPGGEATWSSRLQSFRETVSDPEVIAESVKVLEAVGRRFGHSFELEHGRIGGNAIDDFGTPLPDNTVELCQNSDAILFGAVGGPKWDDPDADTRPEDGILAIRKSLGLFANIRPVKVYPALINSSPIKPSILEGVDMVVLRELTGGLYFARPKRRWTTKTGRRGVDTLRYTEHEIERIVRVGFELASGRGKRLTSGGQGQCPGVVTPVEAGCRRGPRGLSGRGAGAHSGGCGGDGADPQSGRFRRDSRGKTCLATF